MIDLARIAVHESAHALAMASLFHPVGTITVVPDVEAGTLGSVTLGGTEGGCGRRAAGVSLGPPVLARLAANECFTSLVGPLAEETLLEKNGLDHGDRCDISDLAAIVLGLIGVEPQVWSRVLHETARAFVRREEHRIRALAAALVARKTMTGDEALALVGRPDPPDLSALHGALDFFGRRRQAAPWRPHAQVPA